MRIGLIAPPWLPVPPPAYGGTESVLDDLARGLADRGHDVHLFTLAESTCPVASTAFFARAAEPVDSSAAEAAHVLAAYEELSDMDIIHDHTLLGPLIGPRLRRETPPVVATNHNLFSEVTRPVFARIARRAAVVSISHAQARTAGDVPITAVIHHGIDLDAYQSGPGGGDYVLFVGRMCRDKGVHDAVEIARRAGRRLIIATKMRSMDEKAYFDQQVRPLLGPDDELPLERPVSQVIELMRHAEALINPIRWPEPFGLVMAEALACATPVLSFSRGAAPEIVEHGRTGFLCADAEDMVIALDKIADLDRDQCRSAAVRRFSRERMAADHERLYGAVVTKHSGCAEFTR